MRVARSTGLLVLGVLAGATILVRLTVYRDLDGVLTWSWPAGTILTLRATAVAVAAIVGVALAVSGVLLQALLRNPLASPFILGVSSGAALGVMVMLFAAEIGGATADAATGDLAVTLGSTGGPAALGALGTLAIVYALGQRRGRLDPLTLVLVGVIVSAVCGALIMLLQHLVPRGVRGDLVGWMMGSIRQGTPTAALLVAGAATGGGLAIATAMGRAMDAATLGDEEARSIGLALGPLRIGLFLVAGLLAALAVTLAGPIGFVGLVAPHAARLVLGPRHVILVLGAALAGVALLVGADAVSQVVSVGGGRVPVGVFTALVGGPAFIWLLRRRGGAA